MAWGNCQTAPAGSGPSLLVCVSLAHTDHAAPITDALRAWDELLVHQLGTIPATALAPDALAFGTNLPLSFTLGADDDDILVEHQAVALAARTKASARAVWTG